MLKCLGFNWRRRTIRYGCFGHCIRKNGHWSCKAQLVLQEISQFLDFSDTTYVNSVKNLHIRDMTFWVSRSIQLAGDSGSAPLAGPLNQAVLGDPWYFPLPMSTGVAFWMLEATPQLISSISLSKACFNLVMPHKKLLSCCVLF